jgi:DNA-binding response OmpR family regulator
LNVLVIEDDSQTAEILVEEITRRGHVVEAYPTDAESLEAFARGGWDVIISDYDLGLNSRLYGTQLLDDERIPAECLTILFSGLSRDREVAAMRRAPDHVFNKGDFGPILAVFD